MPRRATWIASLAVCFLTGMAAPVNAQGFVEHFEPPVVERGKTTRVTAVGTGFGKPLALWNSAPAGAIKAVPIGTATATRVELDVTVSADAPVGVCGVRLATEDGLGNACLLLVDDLLVRPAGSNPNPTKVLLPSAVWGRFREGTVDHFQIDVAKDQAVSFEAVANRFGKDVDPLITIRDADGRFVAERDNDPGLYFDFRFTHTFAKAGTYSIEIRDARFHGSDHGLYVLRMGRFPGTLVGQPVAVRAGATSDVQIPGNTGPALKVVAPRDPGVFFATLRRTGDDGSAWLPLDAVDAAVVTNSPSKGSLNDAPLVPSPGVACGILKTPGERHLFRMELTKGQKIVVRAEAKAFNSPADLELAVLDSKGKEIRRVTESQKEEISLDFAAGNPGVYGLAVRDLHRAGGPAFAYRLEIRSGEPRVQVTAETEGLTVPRGGYQSLPLTVVRTDFTGPIALTLDGAPSGVSLIPAEIGEGVNALVCRLEASPEAALGIHTLRILARPKDREDVALTLVRTQPLIDRQLHNVDLIPYALREDQRRLPPSLTDRFALQVTPPAPFTVELPQSLVTLGRYQTAEFPIVTTRVPGFEGPISFQVKGGQLGPKEEGRTRVYADLPDADAKRLQSTGTIHSLILTNVAKHRVDFTAIGVHQGRKVSLTRAFDMDVRSAFIVAVEPSLLKLEPGATTKVQLTIDRLVPFDGDVLVQLGPGPGFTFPERVVIPRDKKSVEIEIAVDPMRSPGRHIIGINATATVNGYEEEQRNSRIEIDLAKPAPPKK